MSPSWYASRGRAERFAIDEPTRVAVDGSTYAVTLARLGMETAHLHGLLRNGIASGMPMRVWIETAGWVAARGAGSVGCAHEIYLEPNPAQHRALILRLFTTAFDPIARSANLRVALRRLAHRCLSAR